MPYDTLQFQILHNPNTITQRNTTTMTTTRNTTTRNTTRPVKKAAPRKAVAAKKVAAAPKAPVKPTMPTFNTVEEATAFFTEQVGVLTKALDSAAQERNLCDAYYEEMAKVDKKVAIVLPVKKKQTSYRLARSAYISGPGIADSANGYTSNAQAAAASKAVTEVLEAAGYTVTGRLFIPQDYTSTAWS